MANRGCSIYIFFFWNGDTDSKHSISTCSPLDPTHAVIRLDISTKI